MSASKPTPKPKKAKTTKNIIATQPHYAELATFTDIKLHQVAITSIRTAMHRTECAIQSLARNGYLSTVQHLQQASVHMLEAINESERMIERIKTEATRPNG